MKTVVLSLLLMSFKCFSQTVHFNSFDLSQFEQIIYDNGEYQPGYRNMGTIRDDGKLILDENKKVFIVKWGNGDEFIGKYVTKTRNPKRDDWWGSIIETVYTGKWNSGKPFQLVIKETPKNGCQIYLKSSKIIDEEYKINDWKKTFWFHTIETEGFL